jgi:alkaline phosphatase
MKKGYVDGYVLPVPKKNLAKYKKMATEAGKMWIKCGALQYFECVGDDMKIASKYKVLPFQKMAKAKPNETVIFAFVVFKSKAHRDQVNKKVMAGMTMTPEDQEACKNLFDMKKMAYAGFKPIVGLEKRK